MGAAGNYPRKMTYNTQPATFAIHQGNVFEELRRFPDNHFHAIVTSPPYWRMRRYLPKDHPMGALEIGHEPTVKMHVQTLVEVFQQLRRVLRPDGICWLNYGDSYISDGGSGLNRSTLRAGRSHQQQNPYPGSVPDGMKAKDLCGIPWRLALALQDDGWWLRSDIIWQKRTPMPESVKDRPTRSHEYLFMLTKREHYFYDWFAAREEASGKPPGNKTHKYTTQYNQGDGRFRKAAGLLKIGGRKLRNLRSVWTPRATPYKGSHFATFPVTLAEMCIRASTSPIGCCSFCGQPYRRIIEKAKVGDWHPDQELKAEGIARTTAKYLFGDDNQVNGFRMNQNVKKARQEGGDHDNPFFEPRHVGWAPCCPCGIPEPCRVLDPFSGAGSTGVAALNLGCTYDGVELFADYAALSRQRLNESIPKQPRLLLADKA